MSTEFKGHFQSIHGIEYSSDNKYLLSCSNDKTFKIWDCGSTKFIASNMFHRNWVNKAKFFKDDKLVISCSKDSFIQVYDCSSGKCVIKFNLSPGKNNLKINKKLINIIVYNYLNIDYANTLALKEEFSIAVGTKQGSVQVFDLRSSKILQKYNEHESQINCILYQYKTPCLISISNDKKLNVFIILINYKYTIKIFCLN